MPVAGEDDGPPGGPDPTPRRPFGRDYWLLVIAASASALALLFALPSFFLWGWVVAPYLSTHWFVLMVFLASGAFGGILGPLQLPEVANLLEPNAEDYLRSRRINNIFLAFVVSASGGIGGAFALLFLMLLDDKVKFPSDGRNILLYIASGVLAGFLGFQLLKLIAANLLKNLGLLQETSRDAQRKVEELRRQSDMRSAVTLGLFDLGDPSPRPLNVAESIHAIETLLPEFPAGRRPNMVLANLYGIKMGDYSKAVELLTDYLRKIDAVSKSSERPADRADALFNRASYLCLWARGVPAPARRRQLLEQAIESLGQALGYDPDLVDEIEKDLRPPADPPDPTDAPLWVLRDDPRLAELLAGARARRARPGPPPPPASPSPPTSSPTVG